MKNKREEIDGQCVHILLYNAEIFETKHKFSISLANDFVPLLKIRRLLSVNVARFRTAYGSGKPLGWVC